MHLSESANRAFVALGTNVPFEGLAGGALLARAVRALEAEELRVTAKSGIWISEAWPPGSGQADYANAVVEVDAKGLAPQALYTVLRRVEQAFGRERRERWDARTLDLDIVAMDGLAGAFGALQLPHARMADRAFVLAPLAEIAPAWGHPESGLTAVDLLKKLPPGQRCVRSGPFPAG